MNTVVRWIYLVIVVIHGLMLAAAIYGYATTRQPRSEPAHVG